MRRTRTTAAAAAAAAGVERRRVSQSVTAAAAAAGVRIERRETRRQEVEHARGDQLILLPFFRLLSSSLVVHRSPADAVADAASPQTVRERGRRVVREELKREREGGREEEP